MGGQRFTPIVGTESRILASQPTAGNVWFATDSKKIYYSDGYSFLSMGGNTGIYYANMELTDEANSDQEEFEFLFTDIDGNENIEDEKNYKKPNIDDLILNIPDGCFYRVIRIFKEEQKFIGLKLTIAGSGGGGISSPVTVLTISDADNTNFYKYFAQDATNAKLRFTVTPIRNMEGNGIASITYRIAGQSEITYNNYQQFGTIEFDLTPYLSKMSTSIATNVTITVRDVYGAVKTATFYVNVIQLSLTSNINDSILITDLPNINYSCTPIGGGNLTDKKIVIRFYDIDNNHIDADIIQTINIANEIVSLPINIPNSEIGEYTMTVSYQVTVNNNKIIESNKLIYKVVYYDEEPQLIVGITPTRIEQYSTLDINYMIVAKNNSIEKILVKLIKNNIEQRHEISYNNLEKWSIYFEEEGQYDLTIEAINRTKNLPTIRVVPYSGDIPEIYPSGLTLNYSAINRSNSEANKDTWICSNPLESGREYGFNFENFAWGNINGWQKDTDNVDMLHLSAGAKITLEDYSPYRQDAMENGQTIELDFMISGVTDFSKPLIKCLSYDNNNEIQVGFNITGQESTLNTFLIKATGGEIREGDSVENQIYNTQIQGLTAKFIENKRIHLTWVIESRKQKYPMIRTYLNGILSGITQYDSSNNENMLENNAKPAQLIFDSTYGNIDIYNIRIYENTPLSANSIVGNYIATYGSIEEKTRKYKDNATVLNDQNNIDILKIETAYNNGEYKLSVPYIKIIGGRKLNKSKDNGNYYLTNDTNQGLPTAKKDYRTIDEMIFIDHNENRPEINIQSSIKTDSSFNGIVMYGQGTSSMEYPVKNLRFKSKLKNNNDEKFLFTINDNQVDLVCLKVDYMESSGSHNTGTGNLVQYLLDNIRIRTPGQEKWTTQEQKVLTAIQGFPVLVFYKNYDAGDNAPYEFIGKGNFNLDKATHEPFGFMSDPEDQPNIINDSTFGWSENEENLTILGTTQNKPNYITPGQQPIINAIHCYEFLNNASNLANFRRDSENESFETSFFKTVTSDGKQVPNWFTSYESRYPEGEADDGSDINIGPFYRLCSWLNSTSQAEATNTQLTSSYTGSDGVRYTTDTAQYRLAKFKKEFEQYLNLDFTAFYYVLTHVLLMIDSRAKNMMIATWDNKIWYPIFYDMDTMLGLNNYGYNKFNYDVEDTTDNIYNGQNSVLWNNFRDAFSDKIQNMYQTMQTAGLTYENLLRIYNENQADAVNENIYNVDARYKYIRPFNEDYVNGDGEIIQAGTKDFLYAAQGNRSMHREWWLQNRINYFNGKYLSNEYKNDKYEMRLYTPQNSGYYTVVYTPLEEEFDEGLYYINTGTGYTLATEWVETGITYYKWVTNDSKLEATLRAVPPNNDYTLTPLYNQYISVAYGGANGQTTTPTYAVANEPLNVAAPEGATYSDTETYVYGGSMLKDLGDLSSQYLGAFRFPEKQTKLETLTLGNSNNNYYNPNFSSLTIGEAAPYLTNLNIMNCIGLSGRSIDVSKCQNLKKILATGSGLTSINLASYGSINELRLPNTIKSLTLDNLTNLTDDYFTIGTYDSDNESYSNENNLGIIQLDIQNTPVNSYQIIKTCANSLQRVRLTDVNWIIGENQIDDINKTNGTISVLEILNNNNITPINNSLNKQQSITGTITFKSTELELNNEQAMHIYNNYINIFPNLNFIFEGLNIFDVNILDGNNRVYWTKKIVGGNKITSEFLTNFAVPQGYSTIDKNYTFNNAWYINNKEGPLISGSTSNDTRGWPINIEVNGDITLIPYFTEVLRQYTITFINPNDNNFTKAGDYNYGRNLISILPKEIPYKDDSNLELEETYSFIGYGHNADDEEPIDFTNITVSGDKTYHALFEKVNVYDNIHEEYWSFIPSNSGYTDNGNPNYNISNGYLIAPGSGELNLRGKLTIPDTYNNLPVFKIVNEAFKDNNKISHIFIKNNNNNSSNLRIIGENCFENSFIKYFDFKEGLRRIEDYAFKKSQLIPKETTTPGYYEFNFGNSIYYIGLQAFNQCFILPSGLQLTLNIADSIHTMDGYAFSNFRNEEFIQTYIINIGYSGSDLDLSTSTLNSDGNCIIRFDDESSNTEIKFTSTRYHSENDTINGEGDTVASILGKNLGKIDTITVIGVII